MWIEGMHRAVRVTIKSYRGTLTQVSRRCKETNEVSERGFPNISETLEGGESPLEAAVRALKEECKLIIPSGRFTFVDMIEETKPSPTTGEVKNYRFWDYRITLNNNEADSICLEVDEGDSVITLAWV